MYIIGSHIQVTDNNNNKNNFMQLQKFMFLVSPSKIKIVYFDSKNNMSGILSQLKIEIT